MSVQSASQLARAPSLLHRLTSVVDRLDFNQLFGRAGPVELELGSGDASFLVAYACRYPERNFLGIERLLGRLRKLDRKGRKAGLTNLRGLSVEAGYAVEYLLPKASVSVCHIYFPDPWPKRRHWGRRLVNERFVGCLQEALTPTGRVYLRTDHADYWQQMRVAFSAHPGFRPVTTPADLMTTLTDFERDFVARGVQTLHLAFERSPGEPAAGDSFTLAVSAPVDERAPCVGARLS